MIERNQASRAPAPRLCLHDLVEAYAALIRRSPALRRRLAREAGPLFEWGEDHAVVTKREVP